MARIALHFDESFRQRIEELYDTKEKKQYGQKDGKTIGKNFLK